MVGLGQGAQIGNFGRDGPDKIFGRSERNNRSGQGAQIVTFGKDGSGKSFSGKSKGEW